MTNELNPLTKRIEDVLAADDLDPVQEAFGSSEHQVAQVVLLLVSVPALAIPALFLHLRKSISLALLIIAIYVIGFFFIIQYRFDWIVHLSERFRLLYHA